MLIHLWMIPGLKSNESAIDDQRWWNGDDYDFSVSLEKRVNHPKKSKKTG